MCVCSYFNHRGVCVCVYVFTYARVKCIYDLCDLPRRNIEHLCVKYFDRYFDFSQQCQIILNLQKRGLKRLRFEI